MKFLVHQAADGTWHWALHGSLGEIVAKGTKGFASKAQLMQGIQAIRATVPDSLVFDPLGGLVHASPERDGPPS